MQLDSTIAAVVTGGASGLGEATARQLASRGVKVAIFDMNADRGRKVADDIGGVFAKTDVSDADNVIASLVVARAAHGQERILVNCAGIAIARKTVSRDRQTGEIRPHDLASFANVIKVNLIGTFNMITQCSAGMIDTEPLNSDGERGVIVSTASVAATDGQIGQAAYSASKGGVLGMTLPIARDLSRDGVRACCIMPGLFRTPMVEGLPAEAMQKLGAAVPFPSRLGEPSEFASLVQHICENAMLNGEAIRLDGAIRMAPR